MKQLYSLRPVMYKTAFALFALFINAASHGQTLNNNWKQDLDSAMKEFLSCQATTDVNSPCNKFLGESLNTVYRINDFYSQSLGRYMVAAEIAKYLKSSEQWSLLGPCYDQKTLTQAQEHANARKAVVAVYTTASGGGHIVLITPGALQSSGSWELSVPTATSFFLSQPDRSFINKGLSFAFGKILMKDILIYTRKY
jgi:hypothetical protein